MSATWCDPSSTQPSLIGCCLSEQPFLRLFFRGSLFVFPFSFLSLVVDVLVGNTFEKRLKMVGLRRAHRKSRTGCDECRFRRVKVITGWQVDCTLVFLLSWIPATNRITDLSNSATRRNPAAPTVCDMTRLVDFLQKLHRLPQRND